MRKHLCMDVRGFLSNNRFPGDYEGIFERQDGTVMSPHEAREALYDELAKGHKVIPLGPCDNFDYSGGGCLGHPDQEGE